MANATTEASMSKSKVEFRTIKSSSDIVNFYRFIYENSLRDEANKLLAYVINATKPKRKRRKRKTATPAKTLQ